MLTIDRNYFHLVLSLFGNLLSGSFEVGALRWFELGALRLFQVGVLRLFQVGASGFSTLYRSVLQSGARSLPFSNMSTVGPVRIVYYANSI